MPTSTTTAPGFTCSAVIKPGLPTAGTKISASRVTAAKLGVREWAIITVAFASSSIRATGLPTSKLRPTTTAFCPAISTPAECKIAITPAGVQLRKPGSPRSRRPILTGCRPSASLSGSIASNSGNSSKPIGKGN